jgi:hypothetical protein
MIILKKFKYCNSNDMLNDEWSNHLEKFKILVISLILRYHHMISFLIIEKHIKTFIHSNLGDFDDLLLCIRIN